MGSVAEIRIARRTGFCYGVREAIDKAKEASAAGKVTHTLGQVVHNEGVIRDLQSLGIETVDTLDDVDHGAAVVIRAHGVRPDVMERAATRGLEVIDGTCTWVIQEQRLLQQLVDEGYVIVLLGTPRHPEVVGLLGFAPDAIVVDEEEDWHRIPRRKRMALITQSTQPPWKFEKLAAFMVSRAHELRIMNTVCPVTIRRQEDTLETAREALAGLQQSRHEAHIALIRMQQADERYRERSAQIDSELEVIAQEVGRDEARRAQAGEAIARVDEQIAAARARLLRALAGLHFLLHRVNPFSSSEGGTGARAAGGW